MGSLNYDCGGQLQFALKTINENTGMVIYLRQEGRDIGLLNKVNAYALQDNGLNTVEANHQPGFESYQRHYEIVETILAHFNIRSIRLLINNPQKIASLKHIAITECIPIIIKSNQTNTMTSIFKQKKMRWRTCFRSKLC